MLDLRADIAFNLANIASETNQFSACLTYVREHLELRLRIDANKPMLSADSGIAYSSLGLGLLLTGQYEEAVQHCDKSLEIYAMQPECLDGSFFPTFPYVHRALALTGAGRPLDAQEGLLAVVRWREAHYGRDDTESFKYVYLCSLVRLGHASLTNLLCRLGYVQHCLGLILARSGQMAESLKAYQKAYANYKSTVGTKYHRFAAVCGKIAEYHASIDQFEASECVIPPLSMPEVTLNPD